MGRPSKLEKIVAFALIRGASYYRPRLSTKLAVRFFRKWGMQIHGMPNYISSKVWFDGTDYSLIELGEGCTISSYIRFLTHDWAPDTVLRGMGYTSQELVGRRMPIVIGHHVFVGTGSVIMPGTRIGHCSIVGSGTVARGEIAPYSIVIGSPGQKVGDVRDYCRKRFPEIYETLPPGEALTREAREAGRPANGSPR